MALFFRILPNAIDLLVGLVCLSMAYFNISARSYLAFHEKAAGKPWSEIEEGLGLVILALMKITGLGFLTVGLLLVACPAVAYFYPNQLYEFAAPALALLFCLGLVRVNKELATKTKAVTPWKDSGYIAILLFAGMIVSAVAR
jgi:hypothetical protein